DPEVSLFDVFLGKIVGKGAFGSVYVAVLPQFGDRKVAVKQVLQDRRYRNRELPLMRSLRHQNIVTLLYFFYQEVTQENQVCIENHSFKQSDNVLNLVLEYMPQTLSSLTDKYDPRFGVPVLTIKLCLYQIFRALAYIHSKGICHRDIKPNNLLFDASTGVLKVCDFGSAKHLVKSQTNVSYICARYYRAPELLFGATDYTNSIDIWSVGVVFTELLLGEPLFHGQSCIDQLVLIISKLGTPSKDQIMELNQNYVKYDLPHIKPQPLQSLFPPKTPSEGIDLMLKIFEYKPSLRIGALNACAHPFFDELREPGKKWTFDPFGRVRDLPPLFDFTEHELTIEPSLNPILVPKRPVGDGSSSDPMFSQTNHI
ncbi:unnamed protein product, partial [Medioppia subpectinata]